MGGPDFFGMVKGGTSFFYQWAKEGNQNFLRVKEGGLNFFTTEPIGFVLTKEVNVFY